MADEPTIDLYGMPVKVSDFIPENMMAFITADGKAGVFADMATGDSYPMIRNSAGYLVPKGTPAEKYGVAEHAYHMSKQSYVPDILHDDMELTDLMRFQTTDRIRRYWDSQITSALTGTTSTNVAETLTLEKLEQLMEESLRQRIDLDKKMIRALRAAGMDVRVTSAAPKPIALLPEEYRAALNEINREEHEAEEERKRDIWRQIGFHKGVKLDNAP